MQVKHKLTPSDLEDMFEDAARTLRRLPNPPGSGPKGYGSAWPDYVQDARHAYGYNEVRMRVIPSAADIARMEQCLPLTLNLTYRRAGPPSGQFHRKRRDHLQTYNNQSTTGLLLRRRMAGFYSAVDRRS